jgi:Signal transduction histidine kinase, nitrogen specific
MSTIYHRLLACAPHPMAILQNYHFLLLECNDHFANACASPPFPGCRLDEVGFGEEVESILISQCREQEACYNEIPARWERVSMQPDAPYANALFVRVFYVEPETGHFVIELDYPDLDMFLQTPVAARQTMNSMPLPVLLVDQLGSICVTNHTGSMLCANGQQDMIGQNINTVLPPELRGPFNEALRHCAAEKYPYDVTVTIPAQALPFVSNPFKKPLHLRVFANAARTEAEQLSAVFVTCQIVP